MERNHNITAPARHRTPKGCSSIPPQHFQHAVEAITRYPLLFYHELSQVIHFHKGVIYSNDQVRHAMDSAGYTRKVLEFQAKEQFEPLRQVFRAAISQHAAHHLVFVDETHASPEALRRKYGYAIHNRPAFVKIKREMCWFTFFHLTHMTLIQLNWPFIKQNTTLERSMASRDVILSINWQKD